MIAYLSHLSAASIIRTRMIASTGGTANSRILHECVTDFGRGVAGLAWGLPPRVVHVLKAASPMSALNCLPWMGDAYNKSYRGACVKIENRNDSRARRKLLTKGGIYT